MGPHKFTEMCSGSEVGSYLRLIDSCITQFKSQGPSRTCNESKEEEEEDTSKVAGESARPVDFEGEVDFEGCIQKSIPA